MKKILNPCMSHDIGDNAHAAFAKVEFKDGKLSITGVIGPMYNGNSHGSCGQCHREISEGTPVAGWNEEMLAKFCEIWKRWHLNDLNPCCQHQRALGWNELAKKEVTLQHFKLKSEVHSLQKAAEQAALNALRKGDSFTPTTEQVKYAALPYFLDIYRNLNAEDEKHYEPYKSLSGHQETRVLGHVKPDEHSDGILCRPCPVCGYKYGTTWQREEVPQDVLDWLFALPASSRKPAWV